MLHFAPATMRAHASMPRVADCVVALCARIGATVRRSRFTSADATDAAAAAVGGGADGLLHPLPGAALLQEVASPISLSLPPTRSAAAQAALGAWWRMAGGSRRLQTSAAATRSHFIYLCARPVCEYSVILSFARVST
jgi:hypothetical protein